MNLYVTYTITIKSVVTLLVNVYEILNCSRFKNVVFDIVPGPEKGSFNVKARFLGVEMEEFLLKYQVRTRLNTELNTC